MKLHICLGKIIKKEREKLGMTQQDLANRVKRKQNAISLIESGKRGSHIKLGFYEELAKVFGLKLHELVALAEAEQKNKEEGR